MFAKRLKLYNDKTSMELTFKGQRNSPQKQQQRLLILQSFKHSKRRKCKKQSMRFDFTGCCNHSAWDRETQHRHSCCLSHHTKTRVNDSCCLQLHCKALNKLLLAATMSLILMTSTTTISYSEAAPMTSTDEVFNNKPLRDPSLPVPSTSSYTSAMSSISEEKLQQQQQLFALLSLNRKPLPTATNAADSLISPSALSLMNRVQNRPLYQDDNELDFPINGVTMLETSGFAADEATQYAKAENDLTEVAAAAAAAASASAATKPTGIRNLQQQQRNSSGDGSSNGSNRYQNNSNNSNNCPKECKCLNDYFDCGKKQLSHVPALPTYVQIM